MTDMPILRDFWRWLCEPAPAIIEQDRRREARLLSSVLVFLIPMVTVVLALRELVDPAFSASPVALIGLLVLALAYALSRTRYFQWGAAITLGSFPFAIFAIAVLDYNASDFRSLLAYLVLGVLFGSLLFSVRAVTILIAFDLLGVLLLPALIPEVTIQTVLPPLTFLILVSATILALGRERTRLEADRQAELAKSEERYRQAVENSPNPIFSVNRDGVVLSWNRACEDVFKYGPDMVGQHFGKLISSQDGYSTVQDMVERVFMQHPLHDVDMTFRSKNGRQRLMVTRLYPLRDPQGRVEACVFASTDLTERRRAQEQLRTAYEELQKVDRLKSEMIQNVSHEFRTPLSYIVGYVGLLRDPELGIGTLTDEQAKYLGIVAREAQRLSWLLKLFVAFQTVQEIVEGNHMPVALQPLLEQWVASATASAKAVGLTLSLEVEPNLPEVDIHWMAVGQVVDNLLSNAFKFTPSGGKVTVRAARSASGPQVQVSVTDTGPGIPEEQRERIFERFFQIDGTSTRQHGGLGLGLALCKEIVEAHGQRIWVEGGPEQGARFVFTLPVAA